MSLCVSVHACVLGPAGKNALANAVIDVVLSKRFSCHLPYSLFPDSRAADGKTSHAEFTQWKQINEDYGKAIDHNKNLTLFKMSKDFIARHIVIYLDNEEIISLGYTCRFFKNMIYNNLFYQFIL